MALCSQVCADEVMVGDVGYTNLIGWGWEISKTHCTWNTGDGSTDFQRNPHLQDRKYDMRREEDEDHQCMELIQT